MSEPVTQQTIALGRRAERAEVAFIYTPDEDARSDIADTLELRGLRKVRLEGSLAPDGSRDWRLDAKLGATAVQSCVVTLEPVTTRVDTDVVRRYLADGVPEPEGETEMPEDDTIEPLPAAVDLKVLVAEALALALPDYPRAEGVAPVEQTFAAPGTAPMTDEDAKPFAALKVLKGGAADDGSD